MKKIIEEELYKLKDTRKDFEFIDNTDCIFSAFPPAGNAAFPELHPPASAELFQSGHFPPACNTPYRKPPPPEKVWFCIKPIRSWHPHNKDQGDPTEHTASHQGSTAL